MSLKHDILSMLTDKPRTGYDIGKEFTYSIKNYWQASYQQIYKALGDIEKKQWVSYNHIVQYDKPSKKEYLITDEGMEELQRWASNSIKREAYKSTLAIKLTSIKATGIRALLMELHEYKNYIQREYKDLLEDQKEYMVSEQADFFRPRPGDVNFKSDYDMGRYLVLRRGIYWCKQELEWLDESIELLANKQSSDAYTQ